MKLPAALLTAAFLLAAKDLKGPIVGEGSDKFVRIEATAYMDKAAITEAVGGALDEGILVVVVKVTPAEGKKLFINLDDFLLRSDRSGERATPYTPSQIAGTSSMRITTRTVSAGAYSQSTVPVWGGRGPGMGPQGVGNGTAQATEAAATIDDGAPNQKENPLLAILKRKILPEKEIAEPATGQLYFLMEGKQKVKDLELLYKTEAGRVSIRFKQQP